MTKETVLKAYERILEQLMDEMLDTVEKEFGGRFTGKIARTGATAMMGRIDSEMKEQGRIVVDYAAEVADGNENLSPYERRFLDSNPVYQRYKGKRKDELRRQLLEHFRLVGSDLAPLIASERDDFWRALRDEYSQSEAEQIVDRHFMQADTFRQYRSGVFASDRIAERVISVVDTAEKRLQDDLYSKLDRLYE